MYVGGGTLIVETPSPSSSDSKEKEREENKFWISIVKRLNIIVFSSKPLLLAEIYQLQLKWLLIEPGRTWEILPGKEGPVFSLLVPSSIKKMKRPKISEVIWDQGKFIFRQQGI